MLSVSRDEVRSRAEDGAITSRHSSSQNCVECWVYGKSKGGFSNRGVVQPAVVIFFVVVVWYDAHLFRCATIARPGHVMSKLNLSHSHIV